MDRGLAILERHGLDPDDFTIPGRESQAKPGWEGGPDWDAYRDQFRVTDPPWGAGMPVFNMDDLVRGAVDEALQRRREAAARSANPANAFADRCPGCGLPVFSGAACAACHYKASAVDMCPHGVRRENCPFC